MALPNSGPISGSQIASELSVSSTNVSLAGMADTASFSAPDAYSDFYGYSNIPLGLTSALYTQNLSTSNSWDIFQGDNEINLTPYRGKTARLVIHYTNGTSGTSYQGDFQIGAIISLGAGDISFASSTTNFQTTRTNSSNSSYASSTFYTLADGSSSGRWNRRNTSKPPSSGTGLVPDVTVTGTQYYAYTETSGASSTMLGYGFWFRTPAVTFDSNTDPSLEFTYAHFGSNVGSFRVYLDITA